MRMQNAIDEIEIGHTREAFVVHDDVEPGGPLGIVVERNQRIGRLSSLMHHRPTHIRPRTDPSRQI